MSRDASVKFPAFAFDGPDDPAPRPAEPELDPPFEIREPAVVTSPLVFSSPHSGSAYPAAFLARTRLDPVALRRSEDAFVDELFQDVVTLGAPLLRARFPRAYLDVNREPYELDPRMFEGRLPAYANTRSLRVAGGLGTIARVVGEAQEIYALRLPVHEAHRRIEALYKPYHRALRMLVQRAIRRFGYAILVDCHSMPSSGQAEGRAGDRQKADFVLGDRYGSSCAPAVADILEYELRRLGYVVQRNKPYAGGYITEHFGNPVAGCHAIQVEANRALYMDERSLTRAPGFPVLAGHMMIVAEALNSALEQGRPAARQAAE